MRESEDYKCRSTAKELLAFSVITPQIKSDSSLPKNMSERMFLLREHDCVVINFTFFIFHKQQMFLKCFSNMYVCVHCHGGIFFSLLVLLYSVSMLACMCGYNMYFQCLISLHTLLCFSYVHTCAACCWSVVLYIGLFKNTLHFNMINGSYLSLSISHTHLKHIFMRQIVMSLEGNKNSRKGSSMDEKYHELTYKGIT